jgi:hypothetical protein
VDFFRRYLVPIGILTVVVMLYWVSRGSLLWMLAIGGVAYLLYHRHTSESLCDTCTHNHPAHCRRPERNHAKVCAGYERGRPPRPPEGKVIAFPPGGQEPH